MHVYDPRFAYAPEAGLRPPYATVADYRRLQRRLGTTRTVVVQPSTYGNDNRCTLDAVAQLGESARAVIVLDTDISDKELARLHAFGARRIRINFARGSVPNLAAHEHLAHRLAPMGWHFQLHLSANHLPSLADWLKRLPVQLVFDHIARLPQPEGTRHPGFKIMQRLLDTGRVWLKLSAPYLDSRDGTSEYSDVREVAQAFINASVNQIIWGSDWPHPAASSGELAIPNDVELLEHAVNWIGNDAHVQTILTKNPARLYGFEDIPHN